MHTPIVRQRNIPDRAAVMMDSMRGGFQPPCPPVLSMVTGSAATTTTAARDILRQWTDHPQRLWDVVYETLAGGATTIIHVGPEPNLIPATFHRLSDNVAGTNGRALDRQPRHEGRRGLARRPWLSALLPTRTALLRAPTVRHVILEDWLLEHGDSLP